MEKTTILVGTIGQGVMRSHDGGETWQRMGIYQGMHSDAMVRTLVHHPKRPEIVYAGTDKGLYCSDDAGASWQQQASALSPFAVWAIAIDPRNPKMMFAGTGTPCRATLFRSADGGKTWKEKSATIADECPECWASRASLALPLIR